MNQPTPSREYPTTCACGRLLQSPRAWEKHQAHCPLWAVTCPSCGGPRQKLICPVCDAPPAPTGGAWREGNSE